jgi:hypothetical protein
MQSFIQVNHKTAQQNMLINLVEKMVTEYASTFFRVFKIKTKATMRGGVAAEQQILFILS